MFNLFKKSTIRVQFINANTNEIIGIADMKKEQLPVSFSKPTTMQLKNEEWNVIKAEPEDAFQFKETKQLKLWLSKVEQINPNTILFNIPTISNELPQLTIENVALDFAISLHEDDWRQIEYLPISLLPIIQEEMTAIESILFSDEETENKNGFNKIHVRTKINTSNLNIAFDEFCNAVNISQKGVLKITGIGGIKDVQNGFALKSSNYNYYGTLENEFIKVLCLKYFECMDDEISLVCSKYNLVLVSWCEGSITTI